MTDKLCTWCSLWGGATAANQCEGTYNKDGRGLANVDVVPIGPDRHAIITGQKACRLKRAIFTRLKMALICTIATRKTLPWGNGLSNLSLVHCLVSWFPKGGWTGAEWAGLQFCWRPLRSATSMVLNRPSTLTAPCIWLQSMEGGVVARCWNVKERLCRTPSLPSKGLAINYWLTSSEINMILHAPFYGRAGLCFEEGENEEQVKYQAAHQASWLFPAIATKLSAHEIDPNNKVGCMLAAGPNYPHPVREMSGWSRRRPQELFLLSMCRRVGNT